MPTVQGAGVTFFAPADTAFDAFFARFDAATAQVLLPGVATQLGEGWGSLAFWFYNASFDATTAGSWGSSTPAQGCVGGGWMCVGCWQAHFRCLTTCCLLPSSTSLAAWQELLLSTKALQALAAYHIVPEIIRYAVSSRDWGGGAVR